MGSSLVVVQVVERDYGLFGQYVIVNSEYLVVLDIEPLVLSVVDYYLQEYGDMALLLAPYVSINTLLLNIIVFGSHEV